MLFSTTYGTIYSRTATSDSLTLGRCHSIHGVHEITKMPAVCNWPFEMNMWGIEFPRIDRG